MMATALGLLALVGLGIYGSPRSARNNEKFITLLALLFLAAVFLSIASLVVFLVRVMP